MQGLFDSAIADFTKAIELSNKYDKAYIYMGIAYGSFGQ